MNLTTERARRTSSARRPTCARCSPRSRSARRTPGSSTRPTRRPCRAGDRAEGAGLGAAEGAVRRSASSRRAPNKTDAQAFINKVLSKAGQSQLLASGFLPRSSPSRSRRRSRRMQRCAGSARRPSTSQRRSSRWRSSRCRSSRSSCTPRPGSCSTSSRTPSSRTRFDVSLKTSVARAGADPALRDADRLPARDAALSRARPLAVTLVELPLVLPPAVAGVGLLVAFGRVGLLGSSLDVLGISLPFTQSAVTVAVAFVASPLYIRQAIAAFEAIDPNLAAASRTLGAGAGPHVLPRRAAARARWADRRDSRSRSRAGSGSSARRSCSRAACSSVTQTLPLAIYAEFDRNFDATLAMSGVLVLISVVLLLALRIGLTWQASTSKRSPFLFGPSASAEPGRRERRSRSSGPPAPARRRCCARSPGSCGRAPGAISCGDDVWFDGVRGVSLRPTGARVGLVFQDYALFPHLTVRENIEYSRRHKADEYLERFAIGHLGRRPSGQVSRAASANGSPSRGPSPATPDVLLLDEPLSALDAHTKTRGARRAPAAPRRASACPCSSSPTTSRMRPRSRNGSV